MTLRTVQVNDVELHYTERGVGTPLVLVHGSLADYAEWAPVMEDLSSDFRVIVYSRRYNHPNRNTDVRPDHSALVEADDLAGLIEALELGPSHVGGLSYGAYTALLLGLRRPELVRQLVIVEPVIVPWLQRLPGGAPFHEWIMKEWWEPTGQAYREGDPERALRITFAAYLGDANAWDTLPEEYRVALRSNSREWEALATSSGCLPGRGPHRGAATRAAHAHDQRWLLRRVQQTD
jgi:non-heme chloroperoxidase